MHVGIASASPSFLGGVKPLCLLSSIASSVPEHTPILLPSLPRNLFNDGRHFLPIDLDVTQPTLWSVVLSNANFSHTMHSPGQHRSAYSKPSGEHRSFPPAFVNHARLLHSPKARFNSFSTHRQPRQDPWMDAYLYLPSQSLHCFSLCWSPFFSLPQTATVRVLLEQSHLCLSGP